jgi:hypothetical protein
VPRVRDAGLGEAAARKRARLEAWLDEQLRAQGAGGKGKQARTREDFRREVEQQAAYTLLNRLVVLRLMEASGLRREAVATRGWESTAYKTLRELAPALVQGETSEGYALLLRLVGEELAQDLPGLFGSDGVAALVPVPAGTLRHAVEVLDQPGLASCWTDDMTLGWVYQYWNDPEREALDAKLNARGKLEPHEVASKTQMFTERYMVDWLLQNTLGPMWLAICAQHGWTPEAEANGTLAALEAQARGLAGQAGARLSGIKRRRKPGPSTPPFTGRTPLAEIDLLPDLGAGSEDIVDVFLAESAVDGQPQDCPVPGQLPGDRRWRRRPRGPPVPRAGSTRAARALARAR